MFLYTYLGTKDLLLRVSVKIGLNTDRTMPNHQQSVSVEQYLLLPEETVVAFPVTPPVATRLRP